MIDGDGYWGWDWLTAVAIFWTVSPLLALYLVVDEDMTVGGWLGFAGEILWRANNVESEPSFVL